MKRLRQILFNLFVVLSAILCVAEILSKALGSTLNVARGHTGADMLLFGQAHGGLCIARTGNGGSGEQWLRRDVELIIAYPKQGEFRSLQIFHGYGLYAGFCKGLLLLPEERALEQDWDRKLYLGQDRPKEVQKLMDFLLGEIAGQRLEL